MPRRCAFGCSSKGTSLHRFPDANKYPERFKKWVSLVDGTLATVSDFEYYKKKMVCDIHFTNRDKNRNNRLNALAIPSLHLHGNIVESLEERASSSAASHNISRSAISQSAEGDIVESLEERASSSAASHNISRSATSQSAEDHKMAPILYKIELSPPANAVRMLADIIGLELELKDVNFSALEHKSPEYLKINPIGTVPVLKDDDFILSDSHAMMKYLLSKYGADKVETLYPSDLRTRALVDQALFFDTGVYFIKTKLVALPSIFGDLTGTPDKVRGEIEECYSVLEAYLQSRPYLAAAHFTLADLALGTTTQAMQTFHKLDATRFPRTADWLFRLQQESFFKKIMIPGTEALERAMNSCWEKNKQK